MRYALFLGCTIPVRSQNYEISTREVAKKLEINLIDLPDFSCCGFPLKSVNTEATLLLAARNLAIAAKEGEKICTLCNACTSVLTEANKELSKDKKLRERINKKLEKFGLEYKQSVKVKHFARILYEDIGLDEIEKKIEKKLDKIRVSVHYGCHYLRPRELYDNFDDPENPSSLENLVSITGANVVNYKNKLDCCGGAILGIKEDIALSMAKSKLDIVKNSNSDALITICPFCSIMYEDNQKKIESMFDVEYNLPVLYYPQLLGLALGIEPKLIGLNLNKIKTYSILEKTGMMIG